MQLDPQSRSTHLFIKSNNLIQEDVDLLLLLINLLCLQFSVKYKIIMTNRHKASVESQLGLGTNKIHWYPDINNDSDLIPFRMHLFLVKQPVALQVNEYKFPSKILWNDRFETTTKMKENIFFRRLLLGLYYINLEIPPAGLLRLQITTELEGVVGHNLLKAINNVTYKLR